MGWGLGRILTAAGTLGASELANTATHGGIYGDDPSIKGTVANVATGGAGAEIANQATSGSIYGNNGSQNPAKPTPPPAYISQEDPQGQIRNIYGSEAANLSSGVEKYMSGLRGNLDKNVANADIYNQEAGRERAIAKTKAGLSNTDTSAADEQARRNSIYGAAAINETAKRDANTAYGKGVGNIISGVNRIEQQAKANAIASQPVPVAQENSGGLLDSLFGWL